MALKNNKEVGGFLLFMFGIFLLIVGSNINNRLTRLTLMGVGILMELFGTSMVVKAKKERK